MSIVAGARSTYHAATPPWSPSQPPSAGNSPDRGLPMTGQALYGSMLGSLHMAQQQPGNAAHMASQLQLTASQLAAPPDPVAQNPLACRQLMLQVSLFRVITVGFLLVLHDCCCYLIPLTRLLQGIRCCHLEDYLYFLPLLLLHCCLLCCFGISESAGASCLLLYQLCVGSGLCPTRCDMWFVFLALELLRGAEKGADARACSEEARRRAARPSSDASACAIAFTAKYLA